MTPTQRTLAHLRELGYVARVVEHWNPFARRRVDLFGVVDVLAVKGSALLLVQTTVGSSHAARVTKARGVLAGNGDGEFLRWHLGAGAVLEVWSWRKSAKSRKWELRREAVK